MSELFAGCLMLALVGWLPLTHAATTQVQSRFENSLRAAASISRVEVEWLDTMWTGDPQGLKVLGVHEGAFTRVVRYSYIASGPKYRLGCKLVSGTSTKMIHHTEAAFDGTTFYYYTADSGYFSKTRDATRVNTLECQGVPLVAPFMFVTRQSDDCITCGLRFTELASLKAPPELALPDGQRGAGEVKISVPGLPLGGQPTHWELELEGVGEAFMPKLITRITRGQQPDQQDQITHRLLNYTNLGGYFFPTRIEWAAGPHPPTTPPTLSSTGMVAVLSARIPSELPAEALFTLEEEAKLARTVWNSDEHNFNRVAPEVAKAKADLAAKPRIYDESAEGAKQLADALALAKAQHKRVLLQFGANWCVPCHELHEFLEKEQSVAEALKSAYVVVMIDVNQGHNHGICVKYGQPHALPTIVVVEDDGKMLTASNPVDWGDGHGYSPEKVLAFLSLWAPQK